jgi:hypothetical protein
VQVWLSAPGTALGIAQRRAAQPTHKHSASLHSRPLAAPQNTLTPRASDCLVKFLSTQLRFPCEILALALCLSLRTTLLMIVRCPDAQVPIIIPPPHQSLFGKDFVYHFTSLYVRSYKKPLLDPLSRKKITGHMLVLLDCPFEYYLNLALTIRACGTII